MLKNRYLRLLLLLLYSATQPTATKPTATKPTATQPTATHPPCNATLPPTHPPCNATLPPTNPPCNASLPPCNAYHCAPRSRSGRTTAALQCSPLRPSHPLGANDSRPAMQPTAPLAAARGEGWGWDCPLRGRTSHLPLRDASHPLGFPLAFGAPRDCALIGRWRCSASPRTSASPSPTHTLARIRPLPPCWLPASPHGGTSQRAQAPLRCCRATPCQRPR